jgi:hypothetical protein
VSPGGPVAVLAWLDALVLLSLIGCVGGVVLMALGVWLERILS